jgi:antitoxin component of RelBE/YafQ-DinJ toxin-antitoxin module
MEPAAYRPKKATISLRIDSKVKDAAKNYARQRDIPLAEVVRHFLVRYVEECARENAQAPHDLFGQKPRQFDLEQIDLGQLDLSQLDLNRFNLKSPARRP